MQVPITPEQFELYAELARAKEVAQKNLDICVTTILRGHGVTRGDVKRITEKGIELSDEG